MSEYWPIDLNNTFTIHDWILAGLSFEKSRLDSDNDIIPRVNAGIKMKDEGQLMLMLYSKDNDKPKKFSAQIMMQFRL